MEVTNLHQQDFLSFEDIRQAGRVIPISKAVEILGRMEPLDTTVLPTDGSEEVTFTVPDQWNQGLKELDSANLTSVTMTANSKTYRLTKQAILDMISRIGLSDRYAYKAPGHLIEPHLNYWMKNEGVGKGDSIQMASHNEYVAAFMEPGVPVISNLSVMEAMQKYLKKEFGAKNLFVYPEIVNQYNATSIRVILPDVAFTVETERDGQKAVDKWHYGIHISNSLIGERSYPLALSGFLVEQRSLGGVLPEYAQLTKFSSVRGTIDDVPSWLDSTLEQMFAILPVESESLQESAEVKFPSRIGALTEDLFRSMKINRIIQERTLENMTIAGDWSAYGIIHALASAGASLDISDKVLTHVQKVCGALIHRTDDVCDSCGHLHLFH